MPGNRPKLLHVAMALMAGNARDGSQAQDFEQAKMFTNMGYELKYYLDNAWRRAGGHGASRAAHYKRLAKKRANLRARSAKK